MLKLSLFLSLYQLAFAGGRANWETCHNKFIDTGNGIAAIYDYCDIDGGGTRFICCEAPGGDHGKTTCRPPWECSNNRLPNWKTCYPGNSCAPDGQGNEFECCEAPGGDDEKWTCRPHWECKK
jgi:hypothetical protein